MPLTRTLAYIVFLLWQPNPAGAAAALLLPGEGTVALVLLLTDSARVLDDDAAPLEGVLFGGLGLTEGCTIHADRADVGAGAGAGVDMGAASIKFNVSGGSRLLDLHERTLSTAVIRFNTPGTPAAANQLTVDLRTSLGALKALLVATTPMETAGLTSTCMFKARIDNPNPNLNPNPNPNPNPCPGRTCTNS
jgi:hypothetical protein